MILPGCKANDEIEGVSLLCSKVSFLMLTSENRKFLDWVSLKRQHHLKWKRENKETVGKGELHYLWHPETEDVFSGYGLTVEQERKDRLVGLLMVDRPHPVDPDWYHSRQSFQVIEYGSVFGTI